MTRLSGAFRRKCLFIGDALEFKLSAGLNYGFGASGIALPREFNEDFVLAATCESNGWLRKAECINTPSDGLKCLVHRVAANIRNNRRLHRDHVTILFACGWRQGPVRELIVNQVAKSARRVRIHIAHEYVRVVHAADLSHADVFFVELFRDLIDSLVAALPDGFVNLYLKH